MPPGAHNLGDNRFTAFASSPKRKKKRPTKFNDFPDLPHLNKTISISKYISSTNHQKRLSHYSYFAVQRSLNVIRKNIEQISELRDGNLLLLVKGKHTAEKFIAAKQLPGICDITCKYRDNLNFVNGTVFAPFLKYLPDEEIVKELSTEGVVSGFQFTMITQANRMENNFGANSRSHQHILV
ncbi:PREDICTED: uncharacterized protein LOC108363133 [Rhagoletis zephyria]|uniref:uncharacterized protein LOC108363133 n=1 Tax=Rhagoletis zephyria TaxID=28612 RepID=UPI000811AAE3|nr:PREDICTED: uncharacterized protein LOC108363133 [Rhagoletis zephyria]